MLKKKKTLTQKLLDENDHTTWDVRYHTEQLEHALLRQGYNLRSVHVSNSLRNFEFIIDEDIKT